MRIQGNLATYEFSDLLQWLAQGNKTGVLTVSDGTVEYQLGFDHGRIDMSSSDDPEQRLDNYLFSRGIIDQATLARAERLRDATKMMSGQVLVTLGAITEEQLAHALRRKTEEILCELLTWDHGTFEFAGGDRPATMVPIGLEVTKLLLESMHRLDQERGGPERPAAATEPPAPSNRPAANDARDSVALVVDEAPPAQPAPPATPQAAGLALAAVLDPASPPDPPATEAGDVESAGAELPPHYAAAQGTGQVRRLVPYAAVLVLGLAAVIFYMVDRDATAQAADIGPTGPPILFTATEGPPAAAPDVTPVEPDASQPLAAPQPRASESETERALRERYERQLAELRQELEETRRQSQSPPRAVRAAARPNDQELPPDAIMRAAVSRPDPETKPPASAAGPIAASRRAAAEPATVKLAADLAPEPAEPAEPVVEAAEAIAEAPVEPLAEQIAAGPEAPVTRLELINPRLVSRSAPRYPAAARRHGRGATVTVRVLVGADGKVSEVERVSANAGMGFDRAAEQAALTSVWQPGTRNGEPTEMWAELRFEFKP